MSSTSFTEITYEVEGPAAIITLNRPERLNAFTGTMLDEMIEAFDLADADDAVRAVIVTGAGRGVLRRRRPRRRRRHVQRRRQGAARQRARRGRPRDGGGVLVLRIFDCTKPVIGAINGSAVGVGITMTLPMDIRILADNAKVGFVFAGRGIAPDGAASWFLPRVVGISQALEWVLTARVFRAQEALDGGLVRSIHPADEVLGVAKALAAEIATNAAPVSAVVSRGLLWRMLGADHPMAAHRADSGGHLRPRPQARRPGGRDGVPREAPAGVEAEPDQGPPADLPVVGLPDLRRRLQSGRTPDSACSASVDGSVDGPGRRTEQHAGRRARSHTVHNGATGRQRVADRMSAARWRPARRVVPLPQHQRLVNPKERGHCGLQG